MGGRNRLRKRNAERDGRLEGTERTLYPLSKEYTLNHNIKPPIISRYIP